MTAILLNSRIGPSLSSTWARWRMQQSSGTTLAEDTAKTGFTGQAINGTTTNIWSSRPGWFAPDPTAGNYVAIPATTADTLFALDTLNSGGVFIACSINIGVNPGAGLEHLWKYGTTGAQHRMYISFGANVNVNASFTEAGGSEQIVGGTNISTTVGEDIIIAVYFDVSNGVWTIFPGTLLTAKSLNFPGDGSSLPGTGLDFGIFGRSDGGDSGARLGVDGSGTTMRDLFAIRFTTDQSSIIPNLVQSLIDSPADLPNILEGL